MTTATTATSAVPGSSASPPPNHHLTPRLAAMSVQTPHDARMLEARGRFVLNDDVEDIDADTCPDYFDIDNRSPSPALTVSNGRVSTARRGRAPPPARRGALWGRHTCDLPSPWHSLSSPHLCPPTHTLMHSRTTPHSVADSLAPSSSALASPGLTTISTSSPPPPPGAPPPANPPPAEIGLCSLKDEEELKKVLTGKERLSVLIIGKEIEAFIGRVHRLEHTSRVQSTQPSTSTSPLDQLGPSKKLDFPTTSKYQRMFVYKLASWYGLRAVAGAEGGAMIVGVDGALDPKSTSLRIATLVPETTEAPTQQFRIMQRDTLSVTDEDGASRGTSVSADDGTESSGPRRTLEEREIAYAQARKRIYGPDNMDDDSVSTSASQPRSRQASRYGDDDDDELDVPRRTLPPEREIVYGSLSHPAPERSAAQPVGPASQGGPQPNFNQTYDDGYGGMHQGYMGYMNPQMMGHDPNRQMGPYPTQQQFSGPMPIGSYGPQWQQPPMGGQMMGPSPMQPQMQGMMPPGGQPWYPQDMGPPQQQPHNMMPMMPIPQGMPMPYPPPMPYGSHQQNHQGRPGPPLAHPMPIRPGLDPLSSTASSISSRSYQDVHSRPHSRGSTTSTRSAASSVRLGGMYPSGQQSYGYRQKAVKPSQGSFSSSIGRPTFDTKRSGRQSPASTTSSRSSRRASSIHIQPPLPGQHPLPQRPDWAANNVPYHPSPMPVMGGDPSTNDFPPLPRDALLKGYSAEPMQIEKVKMRPSPGTAWNGGGARGANLFLPNSNQQPAPNQQPAHLYQQAPPPAQYGQPHHDMTTPQQLSPVAPEPSVSILQNPNKPPTPAALVPVPDVDPDFPRRMPSSRTPSLYDPSAPVPSARPVRHSPAPPHAHPPSAQHSQAHSPVSPSAPHPSAPQASTTPVIVTAAGTPNESDIEARLAALSVKGTQVTPTRQPPSYAKAVRRD